MTAAGGARRRPPGLNRRFGEPHDQAAAGTQASLVGRPIRDPVPLLRNVMSAVPMSFERQAGHPRPVVGPRPLPILPCEPATYPGYRFPAEIIRQAVWLYHVFSLSLRDVELILAERGITVTREGIRNWCREFGSVFATRLRQRRPKPGDSWHLDEVFLRINGALHYLWRAVDQHSVVLDVLVQDRRNGSAAKRFLKRLLAGLK